MEPVEKVSALIDLAKARLDKYKQTRELEFKVNIALWTLIVLIGYKGKEVLALSNWQDYLIYSIIAISVLLGHYFFWLRPISLSMAPHSAKSQYLQRKAEHIIDENSDEPEDELNNIMQRYRTMNLFLAGITLILLVLLGVFLSM
ncbi:MAG: hypothetical protein AB9888_17975 [Bacteroidales bacterium]